MNEKRQKIKKKGLAKLNRGMRGRLGVTFLLVVLLLVFLIGVLIFIKKDSGSDYTIKVLEQQNYSSTVLPYKRGDILDRNGTVLATSIKVYNLIIDPKIILSDSGKYEEDTLDALTECFGYDREALKKLVNENSSRSYYIYEKKLTYEQIKGFIEVQKDKEKYPNIQGVWFETEYERKYPFSSLACNIIGFTSSGNVGTWGIEEYYNNYLNGVDGREYGYVNNENIMEKTVENAKDGDTVVSTIDFNIQTIVERYIAQYNTDYNPENIGVVIMDPRNGEILAMSGKLSYDLNNPRDLSTYYTEEEINAMTNEEKLDALNNIWRNYCISDSFEPGSTAKPYTIAAALEEGFIKPSDKFLCDGSELVGGWTIRCHKTEGHGEIDLYKAIAYSCNDALMDIAAKEGAGVFTTYQRRFNFGMKTRVDLPGEESCEKLLHSAESMGDADLATNSFGQNYNVTMIQVASAFSSLVNGGKYYQPHVVKEILNSNGGVVESMDKTLIKQTVTLDTSKAIKEGLRQCVDIGTGRTAGIEGYIISGKTGTAEKYPRGTGEYLLSFIGFAGFEDPELVCYVVVDNPDVENQSTTLATNLFKMIMEEVLTYKNIFPDAGKVVITDPNTGETYIPGETTTPAATPTNGGDTPQDATTPDGATQGNEQTTPSGNDDESFSGGIIQGEDPQSHNPPEPEGQSSGNN